ADGTHRAAYFVVKHLRPAEEPVDAAVEPDATELALVNIPAADLCIKIGLADPIIRMQLLQPECVIHSRPRLVAVQPVVLIGARGSVSQDVPVPEADAGGLLRQVQPLLRLTQRLLGALAVGDVQAEADIPGEAAVCLQPGTGLLQDPPLLAVRP